MEDKSNGTLINLKKMIKADKKNWNAENADMTTLEILTGLLTIPPPLQNFICIVLNWELIWSKLHLMDSGM